MQNEENSKEDDEISIPAERESYEIKDIIHHINTQVILPQQQRLSNRNKAANVDLAIIHKVSKN